MGYQEEYYQKHRDDTLKARALRYASDEAYREATKSRARLSSMNRRAVPRQVMTTVTFDGKRENLLRTMDLPLLLHRSYSVLRQWILSGVMPRPCCRDGAGKGVFSQSQVELLKFIVSHVDGGVLHITYPEMKLLLRKLWRKRFDKKSTLRELVGMRNGRDNRGAPGYSRKLTSTEKPQRVEKRKRVPKNGVPTPRGGKGLTRYGRKVRREDKSTQA